jgi:hypothetical protein
MKVAAADYPAARIVSANGCMLSFALGRASMRANHAATFVFAGSIA